MKTQVEAVKAEYVPYAGEQPAIAGSADKLISYDTNTGAEYVYEIIMVRKDHVVARIVGKHKVGTVVKMQLPNSWPVQGVMIDSSVFKLYQKPGTAPVAGKAKKAGPKRGDGPTKMDKCRAIVKANPNLAKVEMIAKFVGEAGCTPMGANTYYLTIMKG